MNLMKASLYKHNERASVCIINHEENNNMAENYSEKAYTIDLSGPYHSGDMQLMIEVFTTFNSGATRNDLHFTSINPAQAEAMRDALSKYLELIPND